MELEHTFSSRKANADNGNFGSLGYDVVSGCNGRFEFGELCLIGVGIAPANLCSVLQQFPVTIGDGASLESQFITEVLQATQVLRDYEA